MRIEERREDMRNVRGGKQLMQGAERGRDNELTITEEKERVAGSSG